MIIEYRDPKGKYVADIAVINKDKIKYIIEIKDTHATTTNVRPEPWFEFSVLGIQEAIESNIECVDKLNLEDNLTLYCERNNMIRCCNNCKAEKEDWIINLPQLHKKVGMEGHWQQTDKCIHCGRFKYNPVFAKGFRQICKICLADYYDEIKKKYQEEDCMIVDD